MWLSDLPLRRLLSEALLRPAQRVGRARYCRTVAELLEAIGGVALVALFVGVIGWLAYRVLGAQVFGLPAIIGVLAFAAFGSALFDLGLLGIAAAVVGVLALWMIIGMAMTLGPERPVRSDDQKPGDGS